MKELNLEDLRKKKEIFKLKIENYIKNLDKEILRLKTQIFILYLKIFLKDLFDLAEP